MNFSTEVEVVISGTGPISRSQYDRWILGDLSTRARVYALTSSHWSRIRPEPTGAQHCRFMADYLIECLIRDPEGDDFVHGGFEAAREIAAWLKHLAKTGAGSAVVAEVAGRLAIEYKAADAITRNRIETGALEHALNREWFGPFSTRGGQIRF